ncbi:MAG: FimB/Mfa2 family fimbrial subunit [Muribaculaceae bacterium]|nr:FimB/Mfa2 family fimbrial subunit [Muribaculaceae bacterium]
MKLIKNKITSLSLMATFAVSLLSSCNSIYEDLEPCEQGLKVRFVYDYNMEFANAFHSQVDCLTLMIYDSEGNFVDQKVAHHNEISNENYRMDLDLPEGNYTLLAYGGLDCEKPSFMLGSRAEETGMEGMSVNVLPEMITAPEGNALHHLYYGRHEVAVSKEGTRADGLRETTVYMMKDTNDFRVILAYEDGRTIDVDEFEISITDDNTHLDWKNDVIRKGGVKYYPWTRGNSALGENEDGSEAIAAYAEISTSRLVEENDARLEVKRKSDGKKVVSIPLTEVLLLLKSDRFNWMGNQEFLDRQSVWNLSFILTGDAYWANTSIVINNWIVKINNINGK